MSANDQTPHSGHPSDPDRLRSMLTIGDMAQRFGLTLRALRFYEDRGLVTPFRHGTTRFYDAAAQDRIALILRGKHLGYTLTEIARLLAREGAVKEPLFGARESEVEAQINRLERKRDDIDMAIEELRAVRRQGQEMTGAMR